MNLTYDYYYTNHNEKYCPTWIKNENYCYCDSLYKIFSFFKRK